MKRVKTTLLLAGVIGATLLGGCNKQKSMDDLAKTVQVQQNAETVTSEEDYEKVFTELASTLEEGTILQINGPKDGGYVFELHTNQGPILDRKAVCHSNTFNSDFVHCAQNYAVTHGNCISITYDPKNHWNAYGCK